MKRATLEMKAMRALRLEYRHSRGHIPPAMFKLLSIQQRRDLFFWGELEHRLGLVWALRQKAALRQWLRAMSDRLWK